MEAKFSVNISEKDIQTELEARITKQMKSTIDDQLFLFFAPANSHRAKNGTGLQHVQDIIAEKWVDPKFQKRVEDYIEKNWERHVDAALQKAAEHFARSSAFKHKVPGGK